MNLNFFFFEYVPPFKVTGYRCVPRVRARASGRAIPIQRNSTADTSCSEMFI